MQEPEELYSLLTQSRFDTQPPHTAVVSIKGIISWKTGFSLLFWNESNSLCRLTVMFATQSFQFIQNIYWNLCVFIIVMSDSKTACSVSRWEMINSNQIITVLLQETFTNI